MVLFSALLILLSVSLLAVGMNSDTSSDVKIAGNRRLSQQSFHMADGAARLGVQVLRDFVENEADPLSEYPDSATSIPVVAGKLYLENLAMDAGIVSDIQGYDDNDNASDPENGVSDVSFTMSSPSDSTFTRTDVGIDVDRLSSSYLPGSSIEFASGYEGVGKGAGSGSVAVYYLVRAETVPVQGNNAVSSEVSIVYRKVSGIVDSGK